MKGRNVAVVPEDEMVDALVEWAEFIVEHGVEAAVARADTAKAEREAKRDRSKLLADHDGDDVNASERPGRADPPPSYQLTGRPLLRISWSAHVVSIAMRWSSSG